MGEVFRSREQPCHRVSLIVVASAPAQAVCGLGHLLCREKTVFHRVTGPVGLLDQPVAAIIGIAVGMAQGVGAACHPPIFVILVAPAIAQRIGRALQQTALIAIAIDIAGRVGNGGNRALFRIVEPGGSSRGIDDRTQLVALPLKAGGIAVAVNGCGQQADTAGIVIKQLPAAVSPIRFIQS